MDADGKLLVLRLAIIEFRKGIKDFNELAGRIDDDVEGMVILRECRDKLINQALAINKLQSGDLPGYDID